MVSVQSWSPHGFSSYWFFNIRCRIGFLTFAVIFVFISQSHGHGGHDHGDSAPPSSVQTAPRVTAASALFELVAISSGSNVTVYLDRFDTNAPVMGARLDIETPAGPVTAVAEADAYRFDAPWALVPGDYELLFTVTTQSDVDFLTGTLTIPSAPVANLGASNTSASTATNLAQQFDAIVGSNLSRIRKLDPALLVIGLLGFFGGVLLMALRRRKLLAVGVTASVFIALLGSSIAFAQDTPAAAAPAKPAIRDVAQRLADGRVFAPKTAQRILAIMTSSAVEAEHRSSIEMPGRVIPDPNASGFVQTAIGGRLLPPHGGFPSLGSTVKVGQLMALVEPSLAAADQSSIRQSKAELDQDIALDERQIERIRTLAKSGTVSKTQLEEAELTLSGLRERRAALEAIRMEPEQLIAPVAGIVSKANAAPGLIAETNTEVFHIINPARLWVEALSFGRDKIGEKASVATADGDPVQLTLVGAGFAEDSQAQPVHFRVDEQVGQLQPGDRVTLFAETQKVTKGIAAPRSAIIRGSNGEDIVFVHTAPELFEPRTVRIEPLDGGRVIIVAGIVMGDRLVIQGSELLNQLR
jgi:membrane fusion protein, heavy metal efflux system